MTEQNQSTETRQEALKRLAHRWLTYSLFVPPIIASDILLEGKSRLSQDAMAVANFALCVLEDQVDQGRGDEVN